MKKTILALLLLAALNSLSAQNVANTTNRLLWGIDLEGTTWLEDQPEIFWRAATDLLIPCGDRLSLGAFAGTAFLQWDAGVLASWRFDNDSRFLAGLGYTTTFSTPMLRLGYKTTRPWYISGSLGVEPNFGAVNVSLGVGYFVLGGKTR